MRGLGQYLTRRVLGYLAILAVAAVLSFAGIGRAHAQASGPGTRAYAQWQCQSKVSTYPAGVVVCEVRDTPQCSHYGVWGAVEGNMLACYSWSQECPTAGDAWQGNEEGIGACVTPPDDSECVARNAQPGFMGVGETTRSFSSACLAGCTFKAVGPHISTGKGTGDQVTTGQFEWTGVCPIATPPPPGKTQETEAAPPKQECLPQDGSLETVCVKANGERCMSASNGFQACWTPGETGEKTVGPIKQTAGAGNTPLVPGLTLLSGDTLGQTGTPQTLVTTTKDANGNNVHTSTVTYTNFITTNGTNAGPTNDGEPADGSGGDDDEGTKNSASGGAGCAEAEKPVAAGDPILSNLLEQAWRTRCAVESGNSVTTTGGDIADCKTAWAVEGPEKSVEVLKLKALRKSICANAVTATGDIGDCAAPFTLDGPPESAEFQKMKKLRLDTCGINEGDLYGQGAWNGDDVDNTGLGTADEGEAIGTEGLDSSGYGYGNTCPTIPPVQVMGQTIEIDTSFLCQFAQMLGLLVLILAGLTSIRIMTSSN